MRRLTAVLAMAVLGACTGTDGSSGENGANGERGLQGPQGPAGAKGEKGDPGAKGDKGDPGDKGDKGDPGAKGDKGDPGQPGADGAPGQGSTVGGSRLKARYGVGDDGSREFLGWRDTQLNFDCSFQLSTGGSERCFPTHNSAYRYYTDSGCTQPIVMLLPCAQQFNVITIGEYSSACNPITPDGIIAMKAYNISGARTEPANLYRSTYGYGCTSASKSTGAAYFDLGAEIPASSLVGRNIVVQ